jgi:hypothetical protein
MRKRLLGLGLVTLLATGLLATGGGPAAAVGKAKLNVVHGIPGVTVNVCVDGSVAIPDFAPGDVVKNVTLAATSHTFKIVPHSDGTCSTSGILVVTTSLKAGTNYTAVAALNAKGNPRLLLFTNNVNPTKAHHARLAVRHTADAPAVNVWANGSKLVGGKNFTFGDSAALQVKKGVYAAWVSLPGDYAPVIGPAVLQLKAGVAYQVYAWGGGTHSYHLAIVSLKVGTN